jgi:hypothetical protein
MLLDDDLIEIKKEKGVAFNIIGIILMNVIFGTLIYYVDDYDLLGNRAYLTRLSSIKTTLYEAFLLSFFEGILIIVFNFLFQKGNFKMNLIGGFILTSIIVGTIFFSYLHHLNIGTSLRSQGRIAESYHYYNLVRYAMILEFSGLLTTFLLANLLSRKNKNIKS